MTTHNSFTIRDGKILLFTRTARNDAIWNCRFTMDHKTIWRSTGEIQIESAKFKAGEIYDEMRFKVKHNIPIITTKFETVWNEWIKIQQSRLKAGRLTFINSIARTYLLPFFGEKPITSITTAVIMDYWPWREQNAIRIKPSPKSLSMEAQVLRQFLKWAVDADRLQKLPTVKQPYIVKPKKSRHPDFSVEEYETLKTFMITWVNTPDPRIAKRRRLFRNFVMIMLASGMRQNEARHLKWQDIVLADHVLITIHGGKTDGRVLVAQPEAKPYFENQKEVSDYTKPDDYVFASPNGEITKKFDETFERLVKSAGVWKGNDGKSKVIYSMRHTYCTFRLTDGKVDVFKVANNMGTSVEMIQKHYSHILNPNMADELTATTRKPKGIKLKYTEVDTNHRT